MKKLVFKGGKYKCLSEVSKIPKILSDAGKEISLVPVSGITPTNNEIKYVLKVIAALENSGILIKKTTEKLLLKKENYSVTFLIHARFECL